MRSIKVISSNEKLLLPLLLAFCTVDNRPSYWAIKKLIRIFLCPKINSDWTIVVLFLAGRALVCLTFGVTQLV